MSDSDLASRSPTRPTGSLVLVLSLLLMGSGFAGLVYEIVWLHMLQLVIGSSAVSLGVLLATFMGGMCLGSLAIPWLVSARRHPLRVFATLELSIGALGILLLSVMPTVGRLYVEAVGRGDPQLLLRGAVSGACLLLPTFLMGATLPAVSRCLETSRHGVSRMGVLYGANIAGAVLGSLVAGFYLLRVYDVRVATVVAAAVNVTVAVSAWTLARRRLAPGAGSTRSPRAVERPSDASFVHVAIALSGLTALAAEVVWTRLLSLLLGATVYAFSLILAVFLLGLGIGSGGGAYLARKVASPRRVLGLCQLFLGGGIAWTAAMLYRGVPYWPVDPSLSTSPWLTFQLDLARCMWTVLPPTLLWGASFPLALGALSRDGRDAGRLVGGVYAANTVGAIAGALFASLSGISWLGTRGVQQVLIGTSLLAALLLLAKDVQAWSRKPTRPGRLAGLGVAMSAVVLLLLEIPTLPPGLVGYGRYLATWTDLPHFLYVGEGMTASVAVSESDQGVRSFHVSGKVVASTSPEDMRLQRMLGHLPALVDAHPRSVLVVGCGAGVTAGSLTVHPGVERIVVCEIEPLIPPAAKAYFGSENHDVLDDPRVEVVTDDARHYVLTTNERFDVITSDPIHPWVKGAAALYSEEFFRECRAKLTPGGVVAQWVPLYETSPEAVKSELATFFDVFPDGTLWANEKEGEGYDLVVVGPTEPATIDLAEWEARLALPEEAGVRESLQEVGLGSALKLLSTYAGRGSTLRPWWRDAPRNHDADLRLQYLAGLGVNEDDADGIYRSLLVYRHYPDGAVRASGPDAAALVDVLRRRRAQPVQKSD